MVVGSVRDEVSNSEGRVKEDPQNTAVVAQLETQGNNWAQTRIRPGEVFLTEVTGPQTPMIPQVRANIPVFGMSLCSALAMPYRDGMSSCTWSQRSQEEGTYRSNCHTHQVEERHNHHPKGDIESHTGKQRQHSAVPLAFTSGKKGQ